MSYSFSARGATKSEVLKSVADQLDQVVATQPVHAADRQQAYAAVEAFVEIIAGADDKDFSVSVNGSVGWTSENVITGAGINISASLVAKS